MLILVPHVPIGPKEYLASRTESKQSRKDKENTKDNHGQFVPNVVASSVEWKTPL